MTDCYDFCFRIGVGVVLAEICVFISKHKRLQNTCRSKAFYGSKDDNSGRTRLWKLIRNKLMRNVLKLFFFSYRDFYHINYVYTYSYDRV